MAKFRKAATALLMSVITALTMSFNTFAAFGTIENAEKIKTGNSYSISLSEVGNYKNYSINADSAGILKLNVKFHEPHT